jgi:hypothetical protein
MSGFGMSTDDERSGGNIRPRMRAVKIFISLVLRKKRLVLRRKLWIKRISCQESVNFTIPKRFKKRSMNFAIIPKCWRLTNLTTIKN